MAQRTQFPFIHRLRVRWQEVDAQQVVFNGHYLSYLDVAISEYWRAVGLPYPDGFKHLGGDVYVRHQALSYHAPARLDDWLDIGLRCESIGTSSIKMSWAVWSDHRLLVTGEVVYVYIAMAHGRPHPVPPAFRQQIQAHAAGDPVTTLSLGSWTSLAHGSRQVRSEVFIVEQAVPADEEWDADDEQACHALVCNHAGLPLATGRLITAGMPTGEARIGRMAVLRSMRGAGLGQAVLQALLEKALEQGCHRITLHAQTAAQAFYARLGFAPSGEVFDEVGIPHITMIKSV